MQLSESWLLAAADSAGVVGVAVGAILAAGAEDEEDAIADRLRTTRAYVAWAILKMAGDGLLEVDRGTRRVRIVDRHALVEAGG